MENKKMYGFMALGIMALLGISLVAAYQGDYSTQGPNYSEDRHLAMTQIFDNLDYDAWVSLMSENGRHPRVLDVVTEDNFALFTEAHEARKAGDSKRAAEIRAKLGLGSGQGKSMNHGSGMKSHGQSAGCPYAN